MDSGQRTLGIFAKQPVAGAVKTRLAEELGTGAAAALYAAFTADVVARFRHVAARRVLCFTPADGAAAAHFAALAGSDYETWPQPEGDLGPRLRAFFAEHLRGGAGGCVAIGSDSPTLPLAFVERAFELLDRHDCVLGPATDGGYCLLGLRDAGFPVFDDIEWSGPNVLEQTIARLDRPGATLALLPPWYDIDTPADLAFLRGHVRAMRHAGEAIDIPATLRRFDLE
ncbi:MAG: TIGR04282 family arsenosugar biosynthesis glycosyltransferase [Planctomycetales bacterium]